MSHSPLHQRLHIRLAMRQSQKLSSPALSPLPPYPSRSPPKEPQEAPLIAPPAPHPTPSEPTEPVAATDFAQSGEAVEEEEDKMKTTHVRPRTAPASPERPSTAFSTRSTIRQVDPSPESLHNALARGLTDSVTLAQGPAYEPFPPFNPSNLTVDDNEAADKSNTHIPATEPTTATDAAPGGLRRGGTPSDRSSPRKSRSCSPQKSRTPSPRKHMVRTPTLPAHQESSDSAYSGESPHLPLRSSNLRDPGNLEAPDTPSPVSREQKRDAYAPLQIRRPFAESNSEGEPAAGQATHARIADYMRKMKSQQRGHMAISNGAARDGSVRDGGVRDGVARDDDAQRKIEAPQPVKRIVAPVAHIIQAMAEPGAGPQTEGGASTRQQERQTGKESNNQTTTSRHSEVSGASVASKHSVFSTPGRDELERKKPIVEEDEGPFARAKSVQDLEQSRRRVSEGTKESVEKGDGKKMCGMKCAVM
ncbi:hypothetical protein E8E13_000731 [Curvularia kusanoi]|uniref:Uncharacterized protein n=1 Tax=Curvularia kusanoi TaxID=90978 RepID=A0A9P4T3Y8_CURKU|nr:hypothetical protein E8E13_000731 [Curvularia kusanoi]